MAVRLHTPQRSTVPPMSNKSGFTLLELLVALALLGVIGAGLASAMRLGTETYSRARTLDTENVHAASRAQLRRLIAEATPPNLLTPFPKEFRGTQDELTFVTLAPLGFARDAAGLRVSVSHEDAVLIATLEPFDDDGTVLRQYRSEIAREVSTASFSYYSDGEWQNEWSDTAILPRLVRITVNDGSAPFWPEFTVEPIYRD